MTAILFRPQFVDIVSLGTEYQQPWMFQFPWLTSNAYTQFIFINKSYHRNDHYSLLLFYASAFRRRRHYVFRLSVRPSVRSLEYPLSTCTWVRWSTWPTVTVLQQVCPSVPLSVRPERFPGISQRTHGGNGLKFLHADVSWPSSELISLWPRSVDFSNFGTILT